VNVKAYVKFSRSPLEALALFRRGSSSALVIETIEALSDQK